MKKRNFLLLFSLALWGQAAAQTDVELNLNDKQCDSLVLDIFDDAYAQPVRQLRLAAKKGKAKVHLEEQTARLVTVSTPSGDEAKRFNFVSIPGGKVKIQGTWTERKQTGHQFLEDDQAYDAAVVPLTNKAQDAIKKAEEMQAKGAEDSEIQALFQQEYMPAIQEVMQVTKDFIEQHPDRDFAAYLAVSDFAPEGALEKLTSEARNGLMKSHVDAVLAARQAAIEEQERREKEQQARLDAMTGNDAPEITLPQMDGTPLSLSELRGKYVILDFWGKWCYWCMKGMPDMKAYYAKYSDRLEILGLNYRDSEEVWKKTVEEEELAWKHVAIGKQMDVLKDYAVSGFPTKVIISPEGKVLKTIVGEDPAFYEYLDQLMSK